MVDRAQTVERSIILLLFDMRYSDFAKYVVGLPFLFHLCAPLVPYFMDRVGHRRGYLFAVTATTVIRTTTTLMLPLGRWVVPVRLYALVPFAGLLLVNFDIMQHVFPPREQAKLQSLNATGVQIVGVLADYAYLWLFAPDATSYFGTMRPLLVACCFMVLQWVCVTRHPGWKSVRDGVLEEMQEERRKKDAQARSKSD